MEWIEDREPFDPAATSKAFGLAVAIVLALAVFASFVVAGVVNWASAVAGL